MSWQLTTDSLTSCSCSWPLLAQYLNLIKPDFWYLYVTLNFAQTSVAKSRPSVPYGTKLLIIIITYRVFCCCSTFAEKWIHLTELRRRESGASWWGRSWRHHRDEYPAWRSGCGFSVELSTLHLPQRSPSAGLRHVWPPETVGYTMGRKNTERLDPSCSYLGLITSMTSCIEYLLQSLKYKILYAHVTWVQQN